MRLLAPTLVLEQDRAVVSAVMEPAASVAGSPPIVVRMAVARSLVGQIDLSATPFLPLAATVAAALGEDLTSDAPADERTVAGAARAIAASAAAAGDPGRSTPSIDAPAAAAPPDEGRGHGSFFVGGEAEDPTVTHWLRVAPLAAPGPSTPIDAPPGRPVVGLWVDLTGLPDQVGPETAHGPALAGLALLLGPLLHTVTARRPDPASSTPPAEALTAWSSSATAIVVPEPVGAHPERDGADHHRAELVPPTSASLLGLSAAERIDAVLTDGDGLAAEESAAPVSPAVGWLPGELPLRPRRDDSYDLWQAARDHAHRPVTWAITELADPNRTNDANAAAVADRARQHWGDGLCYLAGIGWGPGPAPVLDRDAVARLLRSARIRVWWQDQAGFDALRVIESVEHGCLPVAVMAPADAEASRRLLPATIAPLVLDLHGLARFDTSPPATSERLSVVLATLRSGSLERDLALAAVFGPSAGTGTATDG